MTVKDLKKDVPVSPANPKKERREEPAGTVPVKK